MILECVSPLRGDKCLIEPLSLKVAAGEIVCLMGPSGVGKSSLLDCIRNELAYTGNINKQGKVFSVFQESDQLFPWLTVLKNLRLANKDVDWFSVCGKWNLDGLLNKSPSQCSIGQQQRLSLLRAIHSGRENILCDEPLSGVDTKTSNAIIKFVKQEVQDSQTKMLWVTHNRNEATKLGKVIGINKHEAF